LLVRRVRIFDRKFLPKKGKGGMTGPFSVRGDVLSGRSVPPPSSAPLSRRVVAR
jgi:hypothetical protein